MSAKSRVVLPLVPPLRIPLPDSPVIPEPYSEEPSTRKTKSRKPKEDAEHSSIDSKTLRGEILGIRERWPQHVLIVQVGGFYELYDYAIQDFNSIVSILRLTVITKEKDGMKCAGFPLMNLERYVSILIENGYSVAIVDQVMKDLLSPNKNFSRAVTRIATAGAPLLPQSSGDEVNEFGATNCFLLSIAITPNSLTANKSEITIGLAWTDVGTGEFFVYESTGATIHSDLARIAPAEVICAGFDTTAEAHQEILQLIQSVCKENKIAFTANRDISVRKCIAASSRVQARVNPVADLEWRLKGTSFEREMVRMLEHADFSNKMCDSSENQTSDSRTTRESDDVLEVLGKPNKCLRLLGNPVTPIGAVAAGALFGYLDELFCGRDLHYHSMGTQVNETDYDSSTDFMRVDASTLASLEIVKTIQDKDRKGKSPSTNIAEIRRRHSIVEFFCSYHDTITAETQRHLMSVRDLERNLQRLHVRLAKPRDFKSILESLASAQRLKEYLSSVIDHNTHKELAQVVEKMLPPISVVQKYQNLFGDITEEDLDNANFMGGEKKKSDSNEFLTLGPKLMKSRAWQPGTIGPGVSKVIDKLRAQHAILVEEKRDLATKLSERYHGVPVELIDDPKDGPCMSITTSKLSSKVLQAVNSDLNV
ncbi:DNA mismatch repair ATPase msh1, partial [Entophlyctis luteolus]